MSDHLGFGYDAFVVVIEIMVEFVFQILTSMIHA